MSKQEESDENIVSERTSISLGLVITLCTVLFLGIVRVEGMGSDIRTTSAMASENQAQIQSLKDEDKEIKEDFNRTLTDLNTRLARIEGALKIQN